MTQKDKLSQLLDMLGQVVRVLCRQIRITLSLSCDEYRNFSREVTDFTLARKASIENMFARTVNRHR